MTLEKFLTESWNLDQVCFEVDSPTKFTAAKSDGTYRSAGLIGQEMLYPFEAYVGKKNDLIFKMKEAHVAAGEGHYELTLNQALTSLQGFAKHYTKLTAEYENKITNRTREEAEAKETAADIVARRMQENPLFGSW